MLLPDGSGKYKDKVERNMGVRGVVVDNAPELLTKMRGIFRNMERVELVGCFEVAVTGVDFVK